MFSYCNKFHKINPNHGRSCIYSPDLIKNEKATINPFNKKDNKCFQYAVTVALTYEEIKKDPQRITKIEPFINKYNWEGIIFPSEKDDWKKFEKDTVTIALSFSYAKKKKYILLMFQNITQTLKKSRSFNNFKRRKMALSCIKKIISIIKRNNIKK